MTTNQLDWMLRDLPSNVAGVLHAVVGSNDGMLQGRTGELHQDDAERLVALCSSMRSISTVAAGTYLGDPGARMSMVESDSGYLFVREAGPGALLAVLARAEVDARLLYQQMDLLVARIGEYLSAAPRSDGEYAR